MERILIEKLFSLINELKRGKESADISFEEVLNYLLSQLGIESTPADKFIPITENRKPTGVPPSFEVGNERVQVKGDAELPNDLPLENSRV
ncbi:MAG TPA: hypothetical protein EYH49_00370, partial [Aquifex aeolicus]|nr:hypothetical protein [Aquifex aeolicus]